MGVVFVFTQRVLQSANAVLLCNCRSEHGTSKFARGFLNRRFKTFSFHWLLWQPTNFVRYGKLIKRFHVWKGLPLFGGHPGVNHRPTALDSCMNVPAVNTSDSNLIFIVQNEWTSLKWQTVYLDDCIFCGWWSKNFPNRLHFLYKASIRIHFEYTQPGDTACSRLSHLGTGFLFCSCWKIPYGKHLSLMFLYIWHSYLIYLHIFCEYYNFPPCVLTRFKSYGSKFSLLKKQKPGFSFLYCHSPLQVYTCLAQHICIMQIILICIF